MGLWEWVASYWRKPEPKAASPKKSAPVVAAVLPEATKGAIAKRVEDACGSTFEQLRLGKIDLEHAIDSIKMAHHLVLGKLVYGEPHGPQRTALNDYLSRIIKQKREEARQVYDARCTPASEPVVSQPTEIPPANDVFPPLHLPERIFTPLSDAAFDASFVPDGEKPSLEQSVASQPPLPASPSSPVVESVVPSASELNRERTRIITELGREHASVKDEDVFKTLLAHHAQHPELQPYFEDNVKFALQVATYRTVKLALDAQHAERIANILNEEQAQRDWGDALAEQTVRRAQERRKKAGKLPVTVLDWSIAEGYADICSSNEASDAFIAVTESIGSRIEQLFEDILITAESKRLETEFDDAYRDALWERVTRRLEPFVDEMLTALQNRNPLLEEILKSDKKVADYVQIQFKKFHTEQNELFTTQGIPPAYGDELHKKFDWCKDLTVTKAQLECVLYQGRPLIRGIAEAIRQHAKDPASTDPTLVEHLANENDIIEHVQHELFELRKAKESLFAGLPPLHRDTFYRRFNAFVEDAKFYIRAAYLGNKIESSEFDSIYYEAAAPRVNPTTDELKAAIVPTEEQHSFDVEAFATSLLGVPREQFEATLKRKFEDDPGLAGNYADFMQFYVEVGSIVADKVKDERQKVLTLLGQDISLYAQLRAPLEPSQPRVLDWEEDTAMTRMEYAEAMARLESDYVAKFAALRCLAYTDMLRPWGQLETELLQTLAEMKSETSAAFESDFQGLIYCIVARASVLSPPEEPGVLLETITPAEGEHQVQQIDDLSVATEPKALYTPLVLLGPSHGSDEKGVANTPTETPMEDNQTLENQVTAVWKLLTDTFGPTLLGAPQDEQEYQFFADANKAEVCRNPDYQALADAHPGIAQLLLDNVFAAYRMHSQTLAQQLAKQGKDINEAHEATQRTFRCNLALATIVGAAVAIPVMLGISMGWYNSSKENRQLQERLTAAEHVPYDAGENAKLAAENKALRDKLSLYEKPVDPEAHDPIKPVDAMKNGTLASYLSAVYMNDMGTARAMWKDVEPFYSTPAIAGELAPLYAQFSDDLKKATTPRDALLTFRTYRSMMQQDLNNGSITKTEFDASLGQALRDLNTGEYK